MNIGFLFFSSDVMAMTDLEADQGRMTIDLSLELKRCFSLFPLSYINSFDIAVPSLTALWRSVFHNYFIFLTLITDSEADPENMIIVLDTEPRRFFV